MLELIENVLSRLESGALDRRQAAAVLASAAAAAGAPAFTQASEPTSLRATGLNHLALRVADIARSRDFYTEKFGLKVIRDNSPHNCFLACGEDFIALFRSDTAGIDHYCYTIDNYDPDRVVRDLKAAELPARMQENRVYTKDPDGLTVQISGQWDAWPGPPPNES